MHSSHVSESTSSATTTTAVIVSGVSQSESTAGQGQQGSFVGLSTTVYTPESIRISATYYRQDELRPLSDVSTSQTDPFDALATHQTVTFDDDHQGRSSSASATSSEPARTQKSSQPVDDVAPIVREEQSPDPTDKWIMMSGDVTRPFQCGYEGCGKKYIRKGFLEAHIIKHPSDSEFRCYSGNCSGAVRYRDKRALTRHIHIYHTFEKPFGCEICDRRFRRPDHLKSHRERMHSIKSKKKSPKKHSVSKSSSATSTNTVISGNSQSESTAGQRQQGSFVGLSRTAHTPESAHTPPPADQQFSGLRLLAKVSTSQINPFKAFATHQTVTFDDKAVMTGIAAVPNLPSDQYQAEQIPDSTDTNKWIIVDKSQERPYRCGYQGCDKTYLRKHCLRKHFIAHTGVSKFKCTYPECVGKECFRDRSMLNRHIIGRHTLEQPFRCDTCERRFGRKDHMKTHKKNMHSAENEQKSPKRKRK